jgi:hypothetical protein
VGFLDLTFQLAQPSFVLAQLIEQRRDERILLGMAHPVRSACVGRLNSGMALD